MAARRGRGAEPLHVLAVTATECIVLLLAALLLAAPPALATREVRVGTYDDAPLVHLNAQGRPAGLYVDVLKQIAARNDWRLTYVHGSWDDNLNWLESGRIDLILDIAQTPRRAAEYSLSRSPVVPKWSQIYVPEDSSIRTVRDLGGERIAVNRSDVTSTATVRLAEQWHVRPVFVVVDSTGEEFDLLARGKVAAVATDNIAGAPFEQKYRVSPSSILFAPFTTGFGTRKGTNLDLLAAADQYIQAESGSPSSSYNKALDHWLKPAPKPRDRVPGFLVGGLAGAAALAALFVGASALLRRQVQHKTRELAAQNAALRASEERFRVLVDHAPEAIVVYDADLDRFVDANANAAVLFGCTPAEVLASAPTRFYEAPDDPSLLADVRGKSARALAGETVTFERLVCGLDGRRTPCAVSEVRLPSSDRRLLRINYVDISAQKRSEEEVRALNAALEHRVAARTAELEATVGELESFSYSVSHDLRAPLRAIDGFSKILLKDYRERLDEEGRACLTRIVNADQHLNTLIDGLLDLSRLSRKELRRRPVDLTSLSLDVIDTLREAEPQRRVVAAVAPGLEAHADPDLTRVLLMNIIGNAWKFTSQRETAHIEVGSGVADAGGGHDAPAFFVRDDGAGFDMAYADKLFTAFQRLHRADEFEGTGIGLATVQRIVRRHGGTVWAEAEPGHGATFWFTLAESPVAGPPRAASAGEQAASKEER